MKKILALCIAIAAVVINYSCNKKRPDADISNIKVYLPSRPYEYNKIETFKGVKNVLYENGSIINNDKATLGRVLFYDKALSLNNSVACASCHNQSHAFSDNVAFSKGFEEKLTLRNSMHISNLSEEALVGYFWDARTSKIESLAFEPVANHIEMGFDRIDIIKDKLSNFTYYPDLFKKAYGTPEITEARMRESLGHFLFSLVSENSKFDEGVTNNFINFTSSERRGLNLFQNKQCSSCHLVTPTFSSGYYSQRMANIGLDKVDMDKGRSGFYKIPRLKNIAITGPYMHDGRFKTLDEVLEHYSHGINNNPKLSSFLKTSEGPVKMELSEQDKKDLIAFLNTMTDKVIASDIKFSSPFR